MRLLGRLKRLFKRQSRWDNIVVDPEEFEQLAFAFMGELGYGLISWLPYLNFIKKRTCKQMTTCGPVGSAPFYQFSDNHIEVDLRTGDMWGDGKLYEQVERLLGRKVVAPISESNRNITVLGHQWNNVRLHRPIDASCFERLNIRSSLPRLVSVKYAVISNKDYYHWWNPHIRNFFTNEEVCNLTAFLRRKGIAVVYNCFKSPKEPLNVYIDENTCTPRKDTDAAVLDASEFYQREPSLSGRNRIQINLLEHADFVIAVQGGTSYLPISIPKDTFLLMRLGEDYIDYTCLAKLYGVAVQCFFEANQIINHLEHEYLK